MSVASATAVTAGSDAFLGAIEPGWDIPGNANGGYLLALAARPASRAAGDRPPVAVTAHYLAPGKPGPVIVSTAIEKVGWRFSTVRATLSDRSRPLVAVLGSVGEIESHWLGKVTAVPADMPGPDDCVPMRPTDTFPPPFVGKLRWHPDDAALNTGQDSWLVPAPRR